MMPPVWRAGAARARVHRTLPAPGHPLHHTIVCVGLCMYISSCVAGLWMWLYIFARNHLVFVFGHFWWTCLMCGGYFKLILYTTRTYTRVRTHTHAHTHRHIHTHVHTQTHTQTQTHTFVSNQSDADIIDKFNYVGRYWDETFCINKHIHTGGQNVWQSDDAGLVW